jgi:hypothetical protein
MKKKTETDKSIEILRFSVRTDGEGAEKELHDHAGKPEGA